MLNKESCPTSFAIRQARKKVGLTQLQAAAIIDIAARAWYRYEREDANMAPSVWEYFLLKTEQHPDFILAPRSANHQSQ